MTAKLDEDCSGGGQAGHYDLQRRGSGVGAMQAGDSAARQAVSVLSPCCLRTLHPSCLSTQFALSSSFSSSVSPLVPLLVVLLCRPWATFVLLKLVWPLAIRRNRDVTQITTNGECSAV